MLPQKLTSVTLLTSVLFISQLSFGQQETIREPDHNRPVQFSHLPDSLPCNISSIETLFPKGKGEPVAVQLADGFLFEGSVSSQQAIDVSGASLVIRSTNYPGFILSLSRRPGIDGNPLIMGRLISFTHGDAFILQYKQGIYKWIKKRFYDLVNE